MVLEDDKSIANTLNSHFCNIGRKIARNIERPNIDYSKYLSNHIKDTFYLTSVDESEVTKEIQTLKVKKSPGIDDIRPDIINVSCCYLIKPLTDVYNASFSTGIMPDIWKIAKVIPVFKSGEKNLPENYRPISLLS